MIKLIEEIEVHPDLTTSNTKLGKHNLHIESKFQLSPERISNGLGNTENLLQRTDKSKSDKIVLQKTNLESYK